MAPRVAVLLTAGLVLASCTPQRVEVPVEQSRAPSPTVSAQATSPAVPETPPQSPAPSAPATIPPPPTGGLPQAQWSLRAEAPLALTEVAAAAFGGQIWVAGGFQADGTPSDHVQVYDPAFDAWSTGPALPEAVHHAALVVAGERLYLLGGYAAAEDFGPTAAVRVFDAATGAWEQGPALPEPRAAGAAAFDGQRIVYGGGVGPDGVAGEVFALEGESWRPIGALEPPREHLAAASDGTGRVFFMGGRAETIGNRAEVDLAQGEGVAPNGRLPTSRGGLGGFFAPGAGGCAAGGEGPEGTFAEVECADADGGTTVLPELAQARHGAGAVVVEGHAYVLLGGPQPGLTASATVQALRLPISAVLLEQQGPA